MGDGERKRLPGKAYRKPVINRYFVAFFLLFSFCLCPSWFCKNFPPCIQLRTFLPVFASFICPCVLQILCSLPPSHRTAHPETVYSCTLRFSKPWRARCQREPRRNKYLESLCGICKCSVIHTILSPTSKNKFWIICCPRLGK